MRKDGFDINGMPSRNRAHGLRGQRHGFRHRQIEADQALQTFGPPAVIGGADICRWGKFCEIRDLEGFLHCGTFILRQQDTRLGVGRKLCDGLVGFCRGEGRGASPPGQFGRAKPASPRDI